MASDEPVVELPQGLVLLQTLRAAAGNINEIAWSPDGRALASGDSDGRIGIWDIASGEQRLRLERGEKLVWSLAWSPNGDRLASGTNEGSITIYQAESGEPLETFGNHTSWVRSVAWSPNGQMIASGANDKRVMVWDLERGECHHVFDGHRDRVLGVRFSPDGSLLASAGGDGDVVVWHIANREPIARYHLKTGWQRSVCFSPDSRMVAAGGEDGVVRLLRIADSRLAAVLEGHREGVGCVSFDAGGQLLASRSVDGRIRLWSPSRGAWRLLARIKASASFPMANLAFHPSEPTLAAVDHSRIRLWRITVEALRHAADGLPTAPVRMAKLLVAGARTGELIAALQARSAEPPIGLEREADEISRPDLRAGGLPGIYRLGDPPSRKSETRELVLWDLGAPGNEALDLSLFAADSAAVLVGIPADAADPTAELRAVAASLAKRAHQPLPPVIGVLEGTLTAPAFDLRGYGLPLKGLLPLGWLGRCRDNLYELFEDDAYCAVGSAGTLRELENLLDEELAAGRWVATADDLFRQLGVRDSGIRDSACPADDARRRQLDLALRQLEMRGRLRRLRPGPLVVARGITEIYADAFRRRAALDPRGLGGIAEPDALDGPLELPERLRLDGQLDDLLRLGVLRELGEAGLAFRAPLAGDPHFFFPEHFGKGRDPLTESAGTLAEADLEGDLALALCSLAVRVADGHAFTLDAVHADGASFRSSLGGRFSVMLKVSEAPQTCRRGRLILAGDGPPEVGKLFVETALAELAKLPTLQVTA